MSWIREDNKEAFDEATNSNFELVFTTLETMEQLISDILEYSSAGSSNEEPESVDINELVLSLKDILYVPSNISIEINNTLPTLKGEKVKFQQVFQNLISNAIKFSDKEKGLIEIDVQESTTYYTFSVKDNGIGIEEKHHNQIFKIFNSLQKSKDSSGVGLSIVKKVVDLYGGNVWLKSTPKVGTTFYFTIKR